MKDRECPVCGMELCISEQCAMSIDEEIDEDLTENPYGSKISIRFDENGFEIRH